VNGVHEKDKPYSRLHRDLNQIDSRVLVPTHARTFVILDISEFRREANESIKECHVRRKRCSLGIVCLGPKYNKIVSPCEAIDYHSREMPDFLQVLSDASGCT
jgi:hypothetical protein